jgi:hypothetical protein
MDKKDIQKTARKIVDQKPDPIINFLLRTRILGDGVSQNMLRTSSWYAKLKKEQEPSGSFGRFHSKDYRLKDVPKKLQGQLLNWIWHRPEGFYYYSRKKESLSSFKDADDKAITGVLFPAVNILRRFPCWKTACGDFIQYLINRRGEDGYWDFGKPANITNEVLFPLSENRRKSNTRKLDYTTHVLLLLNSYFDE